MWHMALSDLTVFGAWRSELRKPFLNLKQKYMTFLALRIGWWRSYLTVEWDVAYGALRSDSVRCVAQRTKETFSQFETKIHDIFGSEDRLVAQLSHRGVGCGIWRSQI